MVGAFSIHQGGFIAGKRKFHRAGGNQAMPSRVKREIERAVNDSPRRPKPEITSDIRQVFDRKRGA